MKLLLNFEYFICLISSGKFYNEYISQAYINKLNAIF